MQCIVLKVMVDMGAKVLHRHPSSRVKTQWHETPLGWGQSVLILVGQPTLAYHSRGMQCSKVTVYRGLCMTSSSKAFTCDKETFLQDGSWFSVGLETVTSWELFYSVHSFFFFFYIYMHLHAVEIFPSAFLHLISYFLFTVTTAGHHVSAVSCGF